MKKDCGYAAADLVKDGQVLGLGTGSTTLYFIEKVGMRVRDEGIEVIGIPTSFQSRLLARQWNIPLTDLSEHEIDPDFNLIKGGGAAHTLEKIVDYSADELVIIADESKLVDVLGAFPLPIEIIPESLNPVTKALEDMGGKVDIRMGQAKDGPVITDNGNFILDVAFGQIDNPIPMEKELNTIPGVVENGLFTEMVDKVIIGSKDGVKYL